MPGPDPSEVAQSVHSGRFQRLRPEERLARWGLTQQRLVTTAQLKAVGWEPSLIAKRVRAGRLHPVFSEVYSLGGPPRTDRELWMASVLTYGADTKLGCSPAAELYGWLRFPTGQLHVITPTKRKPRDGITPHHRRPGFAWRTIDHIPVTGPEQTILDCATTIASDKAYRRIVRQAQVDKLTTHARLLAFSALSAGVRGVARLRAELQDGPSPTRSSFEDDIVDILRHGGEPEINAVVHGEELDLFYRALGVGIEINGSPHDNPTAQADDAAKAERLERLGVKLYFLS